MKFKIDHEEKCIYGNAGETEPTAETHDFVLFVARMDHVTEKEIGKMLRFMERRLRPAIPDHHEPKP